MHNRSLISFKFFSICNFFTKLCCLSRNHFNYRFFKLTWFKLIFCGFFFFFFFFFFLQCILSSTGTRSWIISSSFLLKWGGLLVDWGVWLVGWFGVNNLGVFSWGVRCVFWGIFFFLFSYNWISSYVWVFLLALIIEGHCITAHNLRFD